ncbi:hypothetical protein ILUMI_25019 [Ignelater luminosus]|uniref:Uncharacterized protein n=1 Tax=Ignelater luminosus TaxID=2038154 RepID=A0A8K0FWD4_IGNLU|nr:hypothetical protein ILUMI_25019 [Ignelater luminosus]
MKYTVILVLTVMLFACTKGDNELFEKLLSFIEPCVKESNVNSDIIEKLIKNNEFANDNALKCFLKCVYTKAGIMSEDGDFNADELKKTLDDGQSPDLVNKCKDLKGSDSCDTAFLVAKCMEDQ